MATWPMLRRTVCDMVSGAVSKNSVPLAVGAVMAVGVEDGASRNTRPDTPSSGVLVEGDGASGCGVVPAASSAVEAA